MFKIDTDSRKDSFGGIWSNSFLISGFNLNLLHFRVYLVEGISTTLIFI